MIKKLVGIMILGFLISGCGKLAPSTPSSSTTVSLNGNLYGGTVSTTSIKAQGGIKILSSATTPIENYSVVAVDKQTGKTYFSESQTDSSGSFTISNLPSDSSFYLEILDNTSSLAAPVTFGTSGGQAVMAVTPEGQSTLNLGNVVYDSSEGAAAPVTEPTSYLDTDTKVDPKTGKTLTPKGAGNYGKGDDAKMPSGSTYDIDTVDGDKDGLPNFFDADNNGDGIVDELDGLYTCEATVSQDNMPYVFANLKVDYDNRDSFKTDYQDFTIAVGISPNKGSSKTVDSVKVTSGPSWLSQAVNSDTSQLWSATNYEVTKKTDYFEVQLKSLVPGTDVKAGDTLKFEITYTDGTKEEIMKMINFVFTDLPQVLSFSFDGSTWQSPATINPVGTATTKHCYLRWNRPKDERGLEIIGGRYTFEYNTTSGVVQEVEVLARDTGVGTPEGHYDLSTLSDATVNSASATEMFIGLCIRSVANDNAAENLRFSKGW